MSSLNVAAPPSSPVEVISTAGNRIWGYLDPIRTVRGLWPHRGLIWQLAWRELRQRYQGSLLGLTWAFLMPLFTLAVYTFVFNVVLQARWNQLGHYRGAAGPGDVALHSDSRRGGGASADRGGEGRRGLGSV